MQVQTDSRYELLYPKTNVGQVDGYIKPWKVGDVRITSRTDLSDNWLLCNGNTVAESAYPELYAYGGKLAQAGPDQNTWYTPNFTGDAITGNLTVFKECNGVFYVGTTSVSVGRIYVSSDLNNWKLKWNQDFGSGFSVEIPQILVQNNDVYVCYQKKPSSRYGYYGYVKFNDGQLIEDKITSQSYSMDDFQDQRLYFACDGTYFYSFGRSFVSNQFDCGKSTDLFSLFDHLVGMSSNYNTITIMSGWKILKTAFIESKNGKVYYIGKVQNNNGNNYYVLVTIINGAVITNQNYIYAGYTYMRGYLTTENNWLFCPSDRKCYISYDDGQSFSVLNENINVPNVVNFLYEENCLLLYCESENTTASFFYVYKNGVLSKQENYDSRQGYKFFYINNIFWKGVSSYCYTGILLPTYTPADNLSAYIKAKEGE